MKKALLVGIDDYASAPLSGCINDATMMASLLKKHWDDSPNFDCMLMTSDNSEVTCANLKEKIEALFKDKADLALFYFSGHGTYNNLGGYLVTQDAKRYTEGVSMTELLTLANNSKTEQVVIILDCCHSGALGELPSLANDKAFIREGVSILTASRGTQVAMESEGQGIFTSLVLHAIDGGASDVCGKVTVAAVYAYVDQALGAWDQRPLFKSYVSRLLSIRDSEPQIDFKILRLLPKYFPSADFEFQLNPSFESTELPKKIMSHLQKLRSVRLLVPIGEEHMYFAALNSKSCCLTPLGKYYWKLANEGKI